MHRATDVLVLDANSRAALMAVRSLGRAGLQVAVAECASRTPAPAMHSRWAASRHQLPDVWHDPDRYVDAVLAVVEATGARVVLPAHDSSVAALRAHRADVTAHAVLALPEESALTTLTDKASTMALARGLGIRVPRGVLVQSEDDLQAALAAVVLPAVVKPTQSWPERAGVGADRLVCADATDADELLQSARGMLAAGTAVLVQELVPGRREAVHLIAERGQVRVSSAQTTVRTYPPLGGSSVLRRSIPLPRDTAAVVDALMGATGLTGYAEVEFRRDAAGEAVLMEVNARLSASVEVAVRAGLDAPLLLWRTALGLPLDVTEVRYVATRMRWLGGDLRWLVRALHEHGRPQRPTRWRASGAFLGEFLRPGGLDYLGWNDLRPPAVAVAGFVGECLRRRSGSRSDPVASRPPSLEEDPVLDL